MARCITNEKHCRPIFYGAMVTEGIVALIWAAAATYFFQENGIVDKVTGVAYSGAKVATDISKDWLGAFGGILAILGIVAAPITSGDTALRSARLIVADFFHVEQRSIAKRLFICIPIFLVTILLLVYSFGDAEGFKIIWRYFAWCNQTLSCLYFVGHYGLAGLCTEKLLGNLDTGSVYDLCLCHIYSHCSRRAGLVGEVLILSDCVVHWWLRSGLYAGSAGYVPYKELFGCSIDYV